MPEPVLAAYTEALRIVGNPASTHGHGQAASDRLEEARERIASALGCEADLRVEHLTPALTNDPEVTEVVLKAIAPYVASDRIRTGIRTMGAEDMAIFLERVPGCFVLVGSADPTRGLDYAHHHPNFDFDEAALPLGAAAIASAVAAYVIPGG